ncbi:MAG: hypothetical protein V7641_4678 [Blastocatellia bacterium]
MKLLKIAVLLFFLAILVLPMVKTRSVQGQSPSPSSDFTTAPGSVDSDPALDANRVQIPPDGTPANVAAADSDRIAGTSEQATSAAITPAPACLLQEAPTGFDDRTNNFVTQAVHDADLDGFQEVDFITNGLGPVYNAQACSECHQSPVTGGISQITELRAGHIVNGNFVPADVTITNDSGNGTVTIFGRSLINDRAVCPAVHSNIVANPNPPPGFPAIFRAFNFPFANAQEHVPEDVTGSQLVTTFRTSLNLLGDGFVEAINSNELALISNNQPAGMQGTLIFVPLLETPGCNIRLGRFGWKDQHSSLLSFSSDAYLNEMGISNRFAPNNVDVTGVCDVTVDPEDVNNDIDVFARFMRATKAPSRGRGDERFAGADPDVVAGSNIFSNMPGAPSGQSCVTCHVRNIRTADVGSTLGGGAIPVPAALGCKVIHPFGDFLMHNIATGDRIVQTTFPCSTTLDQSTQFKMRTAPLWGVRTRDRLMHDGESLTFNQAILRHDGEAHNVIVAYMALSTTQKNQLIKFLKSL